MNPFARVLPSFHRDKTYQMGSNKMVRVANKMRTLFVGFV